MINLHNWLFNLADSFTFYGGGKGRGGSSKSTASIDPTIKPYVQYGLTEAQKLNQSNNPSYYPGQTYVSPSATTQSALQAQQTRALAGNPLLPAAQANIGNLQTATNAANPMYQSLYGNANVTPQKPAFNQTTIS